MSTPRKYESGPRRSSSSRRATGCEVPGSSAGALQVPGCGSLVAGRYRLIRLLGRGAMGSVFQAEDQSERRCCAVKMLNNAASCGADEVRRFHNEAATVSRLSHRNIVQVYDFLKDGQGRSYLVMELLDGMDLYAYLQAQGRLSLQRTLEIIHPVAEALHSAHCLGIIHRDVKPRNIFLSQQGGSEVVKVVDFGLAKMQGSLQQQTAHGVILGTPEYLSPEATLGRSDEVDARSDQWALAVTAYRLLVGCLPFEEDDVIQLLLKIRMTSPRPLRTLLPDLPIYAEQAILRGLSRRKEDRFPDIRAFAAALAHPPEASLPVASTSVRSMSVQGTPRGALGPEPEEPTRPMAEAVLAQLLAQVQVESSAANSVSYATAQTVSSTQPSEPAEPGRAHALPQFLPLATAPRRPRPPPWLYRLGTVFLASLTLLSGGASVPLGCQHSAVAESGLSAPSSAHVTGLASGPLAPLAPLSWAVAVGSAPSKGLTPHTPAERATGRHEDSPARAKTPRTRTLPAPRKLSAPPLATTAAQSPEPQPPEAMPSPPIVRVQLLDDDDEAPKVSPQTVRQPPTAGGPAGDSAAPSTPSHSPAQDVRPQGLHRLSGNEPRLPAYVLSAFRGERLTATYKVCVSGSGRVDAVTPIHPLPLGDETVVATLRTWRYLPTRARECTTLELPFEIAK